MPKLMRLIFWILLSGILPMIAMPAVAAGGPSRVQASYDLIKDGIKAATVTETYTRTRDNYRIESVTKAVGLLAVFKPETIRLVSEGTVTAKGLRPLTFSSKRTLDAERNTSADFDWEAVSVTLNDRDGKHTLPLQAGTQDRLSAMYQFMFEPLKHATALDFYMTNGSKVDIYNYRVTHGQRETVALGAFKAVYLVNQSHAEESRTEIWLAAEHANFPYKMVITDPDGGKLTQVLTQFNFEP